MPKNKMLSYILPSLISSLFLGIYVLVDGGFIGLKLGDAGLTAINLAWPIVAFMQTIGLAIGISGGIKSSIADGERNFELKNKIMNSTILILLVASVFFTIFVSLLAKPLLVWSGAEGIVLEHGYNYLLVMSLCAVFHIFSGGFTPLLKNEGKTKMAMFISIGATIINFVFDYVFIFMLNLDLVGAAIGSVISQGFIAIMGFIILKPKVRLEKPILKPILIGSLAPFALNYAYSVINILNNTICLTYGGNSLTAAYTLFSYLLYIVQASASGSGDGVQPLVSYYYGSNDRKKLNELYFKTILIGVGFSSIIILTFFFLKNQIPLLYNLSDEALTYYNMGFYYYFSAFFLLVITRINGCFLYSANKIWGANLLTLLEPLVLTPVFLILFSYLFEIQGVFSSFLVIQGVLLLISIVLIYYLYLRKEDLKNAWG